MLQVLLGSACRAGIVRKLFSPERRSVHLRELARQLELGTPVLLRELRQLESLGLLRKTKVGNRIDYAANSDHPLYPALSELAAKSECPELLLKPLFQDERLKVVFLFGSTARGNAKPDSDIDLFVIGEIGLRETSRLIHPAAGEIGREINPYVITPAEFSRRRAAGDHFIAAVLEAPKLFLKGGENELDAMAE